ncbi:MAG TPA: hypothetical protein VL588_00255 [Bdellovibrionota bacterium]|jgi:hypothetical protein|nr:hypothetical protein [Bdellovibrionota bacterium]
MKKTSLWILSVALLASSQVQAKTAHPASTPSPAAHPARTGPVGAYAGGMLGLAVPTSAGASAQFAFGLEGGYHLPDDFIMPGLATGIYFSSFSQSFTNPLTLKASSTSLSELMLFGDYYFPSVEGLHAGFMVGMGLSSGSSNFGFGFRGGYDFTVADDITVGPYADLILSTASGASALLDVLGSVKYHF